MLGLFGTLNLATRALSTHRQGTEVAGHNLANVNNEAYARQRLTMQTSLAIPDPMGPQGSGVEGVAIVQLRSVLLDRQITSEGSVLGSLQSQQSSLQYAQANLGQLIDRQASGAAGAAATGGVGGQHGIAEEMASLFGAFQSLSTNPTSSAERQVLVLKAETLATQFNQVAQRFQSLNSLLNDSVATDVGSVNRLLSDIAKLNEQVLSVEVGGGVANDLRDIRQQRLEELGKLVQYTAVDQPQGTVDIVIDGVNMVSGSSVFEQLEAYDPGNGQLLIRAQGTQAPMSVGGGSIHGTLEARDGPIASLRSDVDTLAAALVSEVNAIHAGGFGLNGTTGENFFTGTDAASIGVNAILRSDPGRIQASSDPAATGNNTVALRLAQLADKPIAALGNETFAHSYGQTVARLGQSLSSVNAQITNQQSVQDMLLRQRDSYSGVSLDEEMTDLIKYQKAFEASARLVSLVDEMLDIVIGMKR